MSAFFLGIVFPNFEDILGLPLYILYTLSFLPCAYALYSLSCHFFVTQNKHLFFRGIAIANSIYCCLTIGVMFVFFQQMPFFSILYFVLELVIIIFLVVLEFKATS